MPYDITYMGMISLLLVNYIHRFDLRPAATLDGS
eukprot:SAG11_NODE_5357_length_1584_cov_3.170370_2_plen_33_part_01